MITHTSDEDQVTHILFYGGKEFFERWVTLKDQLKDADQKKPSKVFILFAISLEKSSY